MDGAVQTYKARLTAKGYTQTPRIDYEETFSPFADIRAIRILIAIAAFYNYEIWQMDVKTAFLNGYLSKEVYMKQPEASIKHHKNKSKTPVHTEILQPKAIFPGQASLTGEELLRDTIPLSYISFHVSNQIGPTIKASLSCPTGMCRKPTLWHLVNFNYSFNNTQIMILHHSHYQYGLKHIERFFVASYMALFCMLLKAAT
ncbi:retrotransposon protein, putative, ty1-copia subclass [Tanacetum coccineum]